MARWPKDNQSALIWFYGDPDDMAANLVRVVPPFKMSYEGKPIKSLFFHKKAAPALVAALTKVWDYYDHDQKMIDKLGMSKTAGTYDHRMVRGSKTKWSNHAYGAAIDINAEQNGFNVTGNIPPVMIAAFKSEGARWGGDYKDRKDAMHFEFCDGGEQPHTFEYWLNYYGVIKSSPPLGEPEIDTDPAQGMEFERESEPVAPKPIAVPSPPLVVPVPPPPSDGVRGDPEIWNVQRRLKAMAYNPGSLDGLWGGLSSGAISGFINDRKSNIAPPTSIEDFRTVQESLKAEIGLAEGERFTRTIAPERARVTAAELAPKIPEVKSAQTAERVGFWGSIAGAGAAIGTGVSKFMGDAIQTLTPLKTFIGDLPWPVWIAGALVISGSLYYVSRKAGDAKNEATQAYQSGSRS